MTKPVHPQALFRISVIGPLMSRADLAKGELKILIQGLAEHAYDTPDGKRVMLSAKTIERWYYLWEKGEIEGLTPKERRDRGKTEIPEKIQDSLIALKQAQPSRSINTLIRHLRVRGEIGQKCLSRSSVYRFLKNKGLSKQVVNDSHKIERRAFEAPHVGDIWYSDVLHGPSIVTPQGRRKTYLISFLDDKSRFVCHSGFYFSENTLSLEHAFKEALLRRGMPKRLVIDNGSAYRSESLKTVCARLGIHLIHCHPYEPMEKGKLERWHRTFRSHFLYEIKIEEMSGLDELNKALWIWIEHDYHQRPHEGLEKDETPLSRWRAGLEHIKPLGAFARDLDRYFYHRIKRKVRKDGVIKWEGKEYEVSFEFCGHQVYLVVDPHTQTALTIESMSYATLCPVFPLDRAANYGRRRQRPSLNPPAHKPGKKFIEDLVDKNQDIFDITNTHLEKE